MSPLEFITHARADPVPTSMPMKWSSSDRVPFRESMATNSVVGTQLEWVERQYHERECSLIVLFLRSIEMYLSELERIDCAHARRCGLICSGPVTDFERGQTEQVVTFTSLAIAMEEPSVQASPYSHANE